MSDNRDNRNDKKLLPEILPTPPTPQRLAGATPPERVNERARLLLQRFRGLGTTAGAAILSLQCTGYGVVDPLPPPPAQCSTLPDPFASLTASGQYDRNLAGGASTNVFITLTPQHTAGYTFSAARVTAGGTVVYAETTAGTYLIDIATDPSARPADGGVAELLFEVDISCGAATTTLHFRAELPPSPTANESFAVERL